MPNSERNRAAHRFALDVGVRVAERVNEVDQRLGLALRAVLVVIGQVRRETVVQRVNGVDVEAVGGEVV